MQHKIPYVTVTDLLTVNTDFNVHTMFQKGMSRHNCRDTLSELNILKTILIVSNFT